MSINILYVSILAGLIVVLTIASAYSQKRSWRWVAVFIIFSVAALLISGGIESVARDTVVNARQVGHFDHSFLFGVRNMKDAIFGHRFVVFVAILSLAVLALIRK